MSDNNNVSVMKKSAPPPGIWHRQQEEEGVGKTASNDTTVGRSVDGNSSSESSREDQTVSNIPPPGIWHHHSPSKSDDRDPSVALTSAVPLPVHFQPADPIQSHKPVERSRSQPTLPPPTPFPNIPEKPVLVIAPPPIPFPDPLVSVSHVKQDFVISDDVLPLPLVEPESSITRSENASVDLSVPLAHPHRLAPKPPKAVTPSSVPKRIAPAIPVASVSDSIGMNDHDNKAVSNTKLTPPGVSVKRPLETTRREVPRAIGSPAASIVSSKEDHATVSNTPFSPSDVIRNSGRKIDTPETEYKVLTASATPVATIRPFDIFDSPVENKSALQKQLSIRSNRGPFDVPQPSPRSFTSTPASKVTPPANRSPSIRSLQDVSPSPPVHNATAPIPPRLPSRPVKTTQSGEPSTTMASNSIVPPPPPPRRSISATSVRVALWDFDGSTVPGGMTIHQGDKVTVHAIGGDWSTVSLGSDRGLVPSSYLSDPTTANEKIPLDMLPKRPAVFDYGKESGTARDLIAVRSTNGLFGPVTKPVVRFSGESSRKSRGGDRIQVFVEGKPVSELRMGESGTAILPASGIYVWDLKTICPQALKDPHISSVHVRFEHICYDKSDSVRYAECTLFIWNCDDHVVVSDVDGTITLSDIGGHLNTTIWQKAGYAPGSYAHEGVCTLFSHIRQNFSCKFLYLTARPLNLCVETRNYLRGLVQGGKTLPLGPCITDATSYYGSLRREIVDKSSHVFKGDYLVFDLKKCFIDAGRDVIANPVFMAGFGNKDTDAMAYRKAGVHSVLTFVINSRSIITPGAGYASAELTTYDDPNLLNWITEMMALFKQGKLPPASSSQ